MNKNFTRKRMLRLAFGLLFLASLPAFSQNESDLVGFLNGGKDDASKLIGAYLSPIINATSYGMTSGWYHTAKAHKTLGFDLGVTVSAAFTPASDDSFTPSSLGLKTLSLTSPAGPNATAPTIFGANTPTTYTGVYDPDGNGPIPGKAVTVNGPEGLNFRKSIGFSAVPVPMIQLGIGIVKNTDLKIRFVPEQKQGGSNFSMLGFGLMHDIKQHLKGIKRLPFDLSLLVAYNSVSGATSLVNSDPTDALPDNTDGKVNYKLNSWVAQALISKKISVLTLYAGVGYGAVNSTVNVLGTYTIDPSFPDSADLTDPFSAEYTNKSARVTAGLRIKLGPVYFNGDYTLQKYNALTVGFGFAVR